ncbi:MAG TPA: peptide chain release factor N(5)-glutamine methyltransferase [Gaiellaceae bacterium]|nr:peptide chain release factor N(5)-glutamine methyltransferase [Gaiellaceae bacterium]
MTLGEVLWGATDYLAGRGVENPRLDAELLLARALGLSRIELYTQHDRPLTDAERTVARELVQRRGKREPLAYVLGDWDFRRLTLKTDARALVPRPETEIVVERCLVLLEGIESPRVVDVGTGSGAIALAIAQERPDARLHATDISRAAIELARENADANGLTVEFRAGDLLAGFEGPFDLVVSNPPYVDAGELDSLEPEVRDWEPRGALVADGQTERLVSDAQHVLNGWLVLEVHEARARIVSQALERAAYSSVGIVNDLAGKERGVEGWWGTTLSTR